MVLCNVVDELALRSVSILCQAERRDKYQTYTVPDSLRV